MNTEFEAARSFIVANKEISESAGVNPESEGLNGIFEATLALSYDYGIRNLKGKVENGRVISIVDDQGQPRSGVVREEQFGLEGEQADRFNTFSLENDLGIIIEPSVMGVVDENEEIAEDFNGAFIVDFDKFNAALQTHILEYVPKDKEFVFADFDASGQ